MKRPINIGIIGASLVIFASCGNTSNTLGDMGGKLLPVTTIDTSVMSSNGTTTQATAADITSADLSLTLTAVDGSLTRTWESISDFNAKEYFPLGTYTLAAWYGSAEVQGFDCPAYYGETTVTLDQEEPTPVAVTATLANAMLTVRYTERFMDYMDDWSAVAVSNGQEIDIARDQTAPLYLTPGRIDIGVTYTKPGSGKTETVAVAEPMVEARHLYVLTVDLDNKAGKAALTVTLDSSFDRQTIDIEL